MERKTAGIVCDNYKVETFKVALSDNGFTDVEVVPFTDTTSTIKVKMLPDDVTKIGEICKAVETGFMVMKN